MMCNGNLLSSSSAGRPPLLLDRCFQCGRFEGVTRSRHNCENVFWR